MASNSSAIDLSKIPVPDAVSVPDSAAIFAQWLARLCELDPTFDALASSDPAYKQGEILSYQTVLFRQSMNDAIRSVLLASAVGAGLDQVGANYDVFRLLITPADTTAVPPIDAVYESDTAFRKRIQLSWAKLSTAGSENAYTFFASSADPDVLDVRSYGPEDHELLGEVHIYVLSRIDAGVAADELLAAVMDSVNKREVRPITDFVTVKSAIIKPFQVVADIHIPYGVDADVILSSATAALDSYLSSVRRIGQIVSCSAINHALHQPGVYTVHVSKPEKDIEMAIGEAPYCTEITLNKVLTNAE